MKKTRRGGWIGWACLLVATVLAVGCGACGVEDEFADESVTTAAPRERIVIGRISSVNVLDISERMEPMIALIQRALDIDVQVRFASDYSEFTRRMEANEYDLAFCAPFQYIQAHEKAKYEAILRPVRHGADTYVGIFVTTNPAITTLEQLRGKRIAFSDRSSTSGYLFPLGLLAENGIQLQDIQPFFLKGHDNVVLNILNRNYDAGACFGGAERMYAKERAGELRILAVTQPIYNEPIAISPKFQSERAELAARLVDLFTTLHESTEGLAAIAKYADGVSRFVHATDTDYNSVRQYSLGLPPEVIRESGL